jgi:hypothetical protein
MRGGDGMNKRELFKMYLEEDLSKAEENYKRWQESYEYYLQLQTKVSRELLTYYKRETEVAYELYQYKLKCYNSKIRKSLED